MMKSANLAPLRDFYSSGQNPAVSLYLNVDGARFPNRADYENEFNFLVHEARKTAAKQLDLNRDQESRLDSELGAIGEFLSLEFQRNKARGLAIFSCRAENLYEVIPLSVPVNNRLFVGWRLQISPLVETLLAHDRYCVLVVNKETTRIFQVLEGYISERSESQELVLKRHNQGGWEQAKLQRRHELQVRNHLKKASDMVLVLFQTEPFDRLAVGIADELWPELDKVLHSYLKEKLAGRFAVDINASPDEVLARISSLENQRRLQEEASLLDSLVPELESGRSFVGGADNVLSALNQRRVELLVVENGFVQPGGRCSACQTLALEEESCPSCGKPMAKALNIIDEARELAIRQDARVKTINSGHPAMDPAGHIAAKLRY